MPHEEYMRRLMSEAQHTSASIGGGVRPLMDRQRVQTDRQQSKQRRSSPRLTSSEKKFRAKKPHHGSIHGDATNATATAGSVTANALAALEDDDVSELDTESGVQSPRLDSARATCASTAQPSIRLSTPPMQGTMRNGSNSYKSGLEQKIRNFQIFSSPSSSHAAHRSLGRSSSNSIGSSQNAVRAASNIAVASRNVLFSNAKNGAGARGVRIAVSRNEDRLAFKPGSPFRSNGHSLGRSDQLVARKNNEIASPCALVDLTGEDSDEEGGAQSNKTHNEHFADPSSSKLLSSKTKTYALPSELENISTTIDFSDHPSGEGQNQEEQTNASKSKDMVGNGSTHKKDPLDEKSQPFNRPISGSIPEGEKCQGKHNSAPKPRDMTGKISGNIKEQPLYNENSEILNRHALADSFQEVGANRKLRATLGKESTCKEMAQPKSVSLNENSQALNITCVSGSLHGEGQNQVETGSVLEPGGKSDNNSHEEDGQPSSMPLSEGNQAVNTHLVSLSCNQGHQDKLSGSSKPREMPGAGANNREEQPIMQHGEQSHVSVSPRLSSKNAIDATKEREVNSLRSCPRSQRVVEESNNKTLAQNMGAKKSTSASKRKKKSSSKKPGGNLTCTLTGTLYCSVRDGTRCNMIRGLWEYDNQAEPSPQRFALRCDIPSDVESVQVAAGGIFDGSFVYQWAPKGSQKTSMVIKESDVNISFADQDGQSKSFALTGAGFNEIGKFNLVGTARKMSTGEAYIIEMQKIYTEIFPSRVPPPESFEKEQKSMASNKKRKLSAEDSSVGSETETSGDQGAEKQSPREGKKACATSMSAGHPNNFHETVGAHMTVGEVAETNQEGEALASPFIQQGNKAIFDQIGAEQGRATESVTLPGAEDKYDPVSMLLLPSDYFPTRVALDENNLAEQGSWQEFGVLQHMDPSITACSLSWNVRNVEPKYYQMIIDFFDSVGIINVQDLLEAETGYLCLRLLAFNEFKAECASRVLRSRLNHNSIPERQSFHDFYCLDYARESVLSWKREAERWYKKVSGPESFDRIQPNDSMQGAEVSVVQTLHKSLDKNNDTRKTDGEGKDVGLVSLEDVLSSHETYALKNHCNIDTAQQLLEANREDMIKCLTSVIGVSFNDRPVKEVECLVEGMLLSWLLRVQEALKALSPAQTAEEDAYVGAIFPDSASKAIGAAFQTPLSYVDLEFIKSQHITSDEELAMCDPSLLANCYVAQLGKAYKQVSLPLARRVTNNWRKEARLLLGISSDEEISDSIPRTTRLDKESGQLDAMFPLPNLCKTVVDEENGGLPRRTIVAYDKLNNVLYEFSVSVKDSKCSPDAGQGAFLTFVGAKVLRNSSKWKKKRPKDTPTLPQTRRPREAIFSTSGATVTLTGANLHGDEHHYGPERDDSVGVYREFTLDDFVDADDNISFSSKHLGCALIELDRYAPLLPVDRKTDFVFGIKDFIFSHEPSSWRFDVTEKLHGYPQVVDFTSDTTGAPHEVAQSHMSMYVNEVGHNMDLVENVHCLENPREMPRSVSYYIYIDKPMEKGETTELLVNYKEHYETMRERRGYGKANLFDGVKSDAHDITRVRRNLEDRFLTEDSIMKFTEDEVHQVIDFIKSRVWDGVKGATSNFENQDSNFLRQCIARRRLHWLSSILRRRLHQLWGRGCVSSLSFLDGSDSEECVFHRGMLVFVHDWPKNDPRPPYTGLATITSISKDKFGRNVFEVSLLDGKNIEWVPDAVVTFPTDDDFKDAPKRTYSNWLKWKKEQELPLMREKMLKGFHSIEWDSSFVRRIAAEGWIGSSCQKQAEIFQSLRWEITEELLFLLIKNRRLSHPFEEEVWCPLSVVLFTKCLHFVADYLLMGRSKHNLCKVLVNLAHDAAKSMKCIINRSDDVPGSQDLSINDLVFLENSNAHEAIRVLIVEEVHVDRLALEDYMKDPQPLDLEWYLTYQVVSVVHPLASLIDWGLNPGTDSPIYTIENLCNEVGLNDSSYLNFYALKVQDWRPLLWE